MKRTKENSYGADLLSATFVDMLEGRSSVMCHWSTLSSSYVVIWSPHQKWFLLDCFKTTTAHTWKPHSQFYLLLTPPVKFLIWFFPLTGRWRPSATCTVGHGVGDQGRKGKWQFCLGLDPDRDRLTDQPSHRHGSKFKSFKDTVWPWESGSCSKLQFPHPQARKKTLTSRSSNKAQLGERSQLCRVTNSLWLQHSLLHLCLDGSLEKHLYSTMDARE